MNRPTPLVSIIIPVYNASKYLTETIGSVLSQTFENWELILIDDGSTDNSVQQILSAGVNESRLRLIQQKNAGQGAARNTGIKNSKGRYIAFLDADDKWVENKLELQLKKKELESVDFIYSLGYLAKENLNDDVAPYSWITGKYIGMDLFKQLTKDNWLNPGTVLMDKSIFNKVGLFDESSIVRGTEDFDMWLRIARAGFVIYGMKEQLAYYRVRLDGEHTFKRKQYYGKLYTYNKYLNDIGIPRKWFFKNYRYFSRELLNILYKENKNKEIESVVTWLHNFDNKGIITNIQYSLYKILPLSLFFLLSNHFLYRIGYKIERLSKSYK